MNLYDMARRGDKNLQVSEGIVLGKRIYSDGAWRGLELKPGTQFRIPDVRRFASFRHFPAHCSWMVDVPEQASVTLQILSARKQKVLSERRFEATGGLQTLYLPWPRQISGNLDLVVRCEGTSPASALVANHRMLSRDWLYAFCTGRGVEIGPGPAPQIFPSKATDVSYLEQMPAEEWNRLYNGGGKYPTRPELWGNYIVGEASDLPVEDGSLNFIFGSHVFEHLANPIGHLERWAHKLQPGGKVVMVVPDLNGTKDSVHHRCSLESMIDEFQRDVWLPEEMHYVRHMRREASDPKLQAAMARMESIHVHYYDNINCQILLEHAVRKLGYADYVIEHTPNHKDFHFVLIKQ